MKKRYAILLLALLSFQICCGQEQTLAELVELKQYTELQKRLESGKVSGQDKDVYTAVLYNVFGKAEESNKLM